MKLIHLSILSCLLLPSTYAQTKNTHSIKQDQELVEQIEILLDSSHSFYEKGNYAASLKSNLQIVDKAIAIDNSQLISDGYRYLAYDYLIINDTLLARESFEKSKEFATKTNSNKAIGQSYMDLGNLYSSAYQDYDSANSYYDKSIATLEIEKDTVSLIKVYFNVIFNALKKQDYPTISTYLKILEKEPIYKRLDDADKNDIEFFWSDYHLNYSNEYEKVLEYASKGIPFAKENEFYNNLVEFYYNKGQAYYKLKKYKEAADYNMLYIKTEEINQEIARNADTESIAAKFHVEQYKKTVEAAQEKTALQAEIAENKNSMNNFLIVLCIVGLLLLTTLFVAYTKRRDLNKALQIKNQEYLEAKRKSEQLAQSKSTFFSTVSHELRTPLYGVIGLSSILLEDDNLKAYEKDLNSLKFSADYLLALINDVLQINKIDANNVTDDKTTFNTKDLIHRIVSSFEYMRIQNNNTIKIHIDQYVPRLVHGNATRLSQILMNLIGNACKFTENGTIKIALDNVNTVNEIAKLRFTISDTGIGIPKEKHATIFDEFTQVENLQYTYQGTGLGLPIVKKLLQLSNSEIILESDINEGASFSFELDYKIVASIEVEKENPILDLTILKDKNILVAEDNRINQMVTKKILEKKEVNCTVVANGKEAVDIVKNKSFDLILMDLNMPIMNGYEATIAIRAFDPKIPIVALTAVEIEEVRNEIYEAGMNDIVVKPYDVAKFAQTIVENLVRK